MSTSEKTPQGAFEKWFGRSVRISTLVGGWLSFGFEVLSPSRTLWVGLLAVGLIGGNAAAFVSSLAEGGFKIRIERDKDQKPS